MPLKTKNLRTLAPQAINPQWYNISLNEHTLCREHPDEVNLGTPDTVSTTSQKASPAQTLQSHHHLFYPIKKHLEPSSTTKRLEIEQRAQEMPTLRYCFTVQLSLPSFAMWTESVITLAEPKATKIVLLGLCITEIYLCIIIHTNNVLEKRPEYYQVHY